MASLVEWRFVADSEGASAGGSGTTIGSARTLEGVGCSAVWVARRQAGIPVGEIGCRDRSRLTRVASVERREKKRHPREERGIYLSTSDVGDPKLVLAFLQVVVRILLVSRIE